MRDDQAIIKAISEGHEDALVELMGQYREPVFRLAYRYAGNALDAANLAEEIFAKVYFNAHRYRPKATVKSWLFTIAANQCRDFLRRERRHRQSISLSASPLSADDPRPLSERIPGTDKDGAESTESSERLDELRRAIRSLPDKLRFPFVFCALEGHSHEAAAEILHTSRKTVESRIYRARKQLQAMLESRS